MQHSDGLTPAFLSTPTERKISGLEIEVESLKKQLEEEQRKCLAIGQERMDLRKELENKKNGGVRPLLLMAGLGMFFICIKFFTTHRLSPDIGLEGESKAGQVTGFHYEVKSWWGLSKETYNQIRFSAGYPQYWDGAQWKTVPEQAWGISAESEDTTSGEYYK